MTDTSKFKWAELCVGSNMYRGDLQPGRESWAKSLQSSWDKPVFIGGFYFTDEAKAFIESKQAKAMDAFNAMMLKATTDGLPEDMWPKKPRPSLAGYRGAHWAPFIMLDIDTRRETPATKRVVENGRGRWIDRTPAETEVFNRENPNWKPETEAPRKELFEVLRMLEANGVKPESILICFSGNKGFHLYVPTAYFTPEPCETFAYRIRWMVQENLAKELKTKEVPIPDESMDWQVFQPLVVLRAMNSKHEKSGLYKIPITYDDVVHMTFEEIRERAKKPVVGFKHPDWKNITVSTELTKLWGLSLEAAKQRAASEAANKGFVAEGRIHFEADRELKIKGQVPQRPLCVLKLLQSDVGKGNRNQAMLIIASDLKRQGYTPDKVMDMMRPWLKLQKGSHHTEQILHNQIEYVFREEFNWGCNHPLVMANCFKACFKYKHAEETRGVSLKRMPDVLPDLVLRERIPITYHFPYAPFSSSIRLRPGMVVTLVAETGTGKTAFAMDFCRFNSWNIERLNQQGYDSEGACGFISLEMPAPELVERGAQWAIGTDQAGVATVIKAQIAAEDASEPAAASFVNLRKDLERHYSRVYICDDDFVDMDKLAVIIRAGKEKHNIGFWAIDYMGRIQGKGLSYEKISSIARDMKTLARQTGVIIFILVQVGREASKVGLGLRSGRNSGEIEESSDILVTAELEDKELPEEERSGIIIFKNQKFRAGKKGGVCRLRFQGEHMRFFPVDNDPKESSYSDGPSL